MRISSPPLKYPCFYGIDISTTKELIAAKKSVEEIRDFIGADSLAFLSLDGLVESIGLGADAPYGGLCVAYFNGDYPTALADYEADFLKSLTPEDRVRLPVQEQVRGQRVQGAADGGTRITVSGSAWRFDHPEPDSLHVRNHKEEHWNPRKV